MHLESMYNLYNNSSDSSCHRRVARMPINASYPVELSHPFILQGSLMCIKKHSPKGVEPLVTACAQDDRSIF